MKRKGIFINSPKSVCSIHEVGLMCYDIMKQSNEFELSYVEGPPYDTAYDFFILNYHMITNNWMTNDFINKIKKIGPVIALVLEVGFDDPLSKTPRIFDHYFVLDPSIQPTHHITPLPRPLTTFPSSSSSQSSPTPPVIGSFGFASDGKHWHEIVEQVNKEFDDAVIKFNIPHATFIPYNKERIQSIEYDCWKKITKPGIKLEITSYNFSLQQLVDWCAQNTINCFFYFREHVLPQGLAAVTDQAVASGKPLLITNDKTFRHLHPYVPVYPNISIKEAIEQTPSGIKRMCEDWKAENFIKACEKGIYSVFEIKPPVVVEPRKKLL